LEGRFREPDGIEPFEFKQSEIGKNLQLKIDFDKDIESGKNIIVLAHQPGIGKTYNVLEYIKEHPNSFYFTDRHKAIDEHTSDWENKIKFSHWKGFTKICTTEEVNNLYNKYHFAPNDIFKKCKWRDKPLDNKTYSEQFDKRIRVFAPFNYLNSPMFWKELPEIVFIDERISQLEEYHFEAEKLSKNLKLIGTPPIFRDKITEKDYYFFLNEAVRHEIKSAYMDYVLDCLDKGKVDRLKELNNFNPYELDGYVYWGRIYKFNSDIYTLPFYYYAFSVVARGKPIVILDATFNLNLFYYFLESYNGELRNQGKDGFSKVKANVKIYYSDYQNPNSIIYRMRPTGSWPRSSIVGAWKEKTKEWVSRDMRQIMDIFGQENVGVITFKNYGDICQSFGFDMEYFGGLRGTNILEDKLVLVIIGGWFPPPHSKSIPDDQRSPDKEYLDTLVRKYFYRDILLKDVKDVYIGAPESVETSHEQLKSGIARFTTEKKWSEKDKPADIAEAHPVSMVNTMFCDEIYQAFHRNRSLRYPRIIFAYGWFPEPKAVYHFKGGEEGDRRIEEFIYYNLREEFGDNVEKIINDWIDQEAYKKGLYFFDWLATKYSQGKVLRIIREFEKGDVRGVAPSNTDIANKYEIWKGSGAGPDVQQIKLFRRIYEDTKLKAKDKKRGSKNKQK
jgi:hypothetical protein